MLIFRHTMSAERKGVEVKQVSLIEMSRGQPVLGAVFTKTNVEKTAYKDSLFEAELVVVIKIDHQKERTN